jgi:hypothetical protein
LHELSGGRGRILTLPSANWTWVGLSFVLKALNIWVLLERTRYARRAPRVTPIREPMAACLANMPDAFRTVSRSDCWRSCWKCSSASLLRSSPWFLRVMARASEDMISDAWTIGICFAVDVNGKFHVADVLCSCVRILTSQAGVHLSSAKQSMIPRPTTGQCAQCAQWAACGAQLSPIM